MTSRKARIFGVLLALAVLPLAGCSRWHRAHSGGHDGGPAGDPGKQAARPPAAPKAPVFLHVAPPIAFEMLHDSPDLLILDLRKPQDFNGETGHLFRSYNIPLERLPYRLLDISPFREETFLVYCDTQVCAEEGMAILASSGFAAAVVMDGGIDSWIRKGYRTVLPGNLAGHAAETAAATKGRRGLFDPPPSATGPPPP